MTEKINLKQRINRSGSERALLAICLNDPNVVVEATSSGLSPDMFAVDGNRYIYMAIAYLVANDKPVDPVSIMSVFDSEEATMAIEELGGLDYLDAMQQSRIAPNTSLYIEQIKQAAIRREIYVQAERMQKQALEDDTTRVSDYLSRTEAMIQEISLKVETEEEVYKMGSDVNDRLKERAKNPTLTPGIVTGMPSLDKAMGGLRKKTLSIIGARSKVGKSVVLTNWARKIAVEDSVPVLYIDTEMYNDQQEDRLIAQLSGVPVNEIASGMFAKDSFHGKAKDKIQRIQQATRMIRDGNFYHVYMPFFTPEILRTIAKQYVIKHGIKVLFFDYIKLPSSEGNNMSQEYQRLGVVTSTLKDIAGTLDIAVASAVQLNRGAVGAEEIDESMIAGSDRILQLADTLMFLRNKTEEEYALEGGFTAGNQKLIVALQRSGASNMDPINIKFEREITRVSEA